MRRRTRCSPKGIAGAYFTARMREVTTGYSIRRLIFCTSAEMTGGYTTERMRGVTAGHSIHRPTLRVGGNDGRVHHGTHARSNGWSFDSQAHTLRVDGNDGRVHDSGSAEARGVRVGGRARPLVLHLVIALDRVHNRHVLVHAVDGENLADLHRDWHPAAAVPQRRHHAPLVPLRVEALHRLQRAFTPVGSAHGVQVARQRHRAEVVAAALHGRVLRPRVRGRVVVFHVVEVAHAVIEPADRVHVGVENRQREPATLTEHARDRLPALGLGREPLHVAEKEGDCHTLWGPARCWAISAASLVSVRRKAPPPPPPTYTPLPPIPTSPKG